MSEGNFKEKEKLVKGPIWAPDTKTDWPTGRKLTSTSTSTAAVSYWTELQKTIVWRAPKSIDLDKMRLFKMESTL
jgi:hypothetical protein